jgi:hypothetical protein
MIIPGAVMAVENKKKIEEEIKTLDRLKKREEELLKKIKAAKK